MEPEMFRAGEELDPIYANRYKMAPDAQLNVAVKLESRKLGTSLNLKRRPSGPVRKLSLFFDFFLILNFRPRDRRVVQSCLLNFFHPSFPSLSLSLRPPPPPG